jgi:hypothetical protein
MRYENRLPSQCTKFAKTQTKRRGGVQVTAIFGKTGCKVMMGVGLWA